MRNIVVFLSIVVGVISSVVAFRSSQASFTSQKELNNEIYSRLIVEEELGLANGKISSVENELARIKAKLNSVEILLEQTNTINEDLKQKLSASFGEKENLLKRLKEAQLSASNH